MKYYRLIVKGSYEQAETVARQHGCSIIQSQDSPCGNTTILDVSHEKEAQLQAWFIKDPITPPFPPGTLLWYRER